MSDGVKIACIIMAGIVIAALLLSRWQPLQHASLSLKEVAGIKMVVGK